MATVLVLPALSRNPGTTAFGPVAVPTGITQIEVQLDRAGMASETLRIDWALEVSQDSGATWLSWGGASTAGGPPLTGVSSFTIALPNPSNAGRRVRGSVTLNETVTLSIVLVTSP